jgi:hypothetical protein
LYIIKRRKSTSNVHILGTNCLLNHVFEGKIEGVIKVTGRSERKRKKLLDYCKETRGYWKLKENALDRTLWKARFGRNLGEAIEKNYIKISTCKCLVMLIVSYVAGLQPLDSKTRVQFCFTFS